MTFQRQSGQWESPDKIRVLIFVGRHRSKYLGAERTSGKSSDPWTPVPSSGDSGQQWECSPHCEKQRAGEGEKEGERRWRKRRKEMERRGNKR